MAQVPDTRLSLLLRLPDALDAEAWQEFAAIYEPFVFRFAIRNGLQPVDAEDFVQAVMAGVARSISNWKPDDQRARFRTWLFRIAKNQFIKLVQSRRQLLSLDDSKAQGLAVDGQQDIEELEYRRAVFRWAAAKVKEEVRPPTWTAFWETSVAERSIPEVAEELGVRPAMIHVARSRVIARLRNKVELFERNED